MKVFIDGKEYIEAVGLEVEIIKRLEEREVSAKRSILCALNHAKTVLDDYKGAGLTVNSIEAEGAYRALLGLAIDLYLVEEDGSEKCQKQ